MCVEVCGLREAGAEQIRGAGGDVTSLRGSEVGCDERPYMQRLGMSGACRQLRGNLQLAAQPSGSELTEGRSGDATALFAKVHLPGVMRSEVTKLPERKSRCLSVRVVFGLGTDAPHLLALNHLHHPIVSLSPTPTPRPMPFRYPVLPHCSVYCDPSVPANLYLALCRRTSGP